jgi:formiminotetrahydrofolate cyclodeaminase
MADDVPLSTYALIDLLDAFASNEPVPGGGSAAALAGAVGVSLLMMAAGLPKTKTGAPEEAADLSEAAARLRPLRETLTAMVDQDSDAYRAVLAAFRLPKTTEAQTGARAGAIQEAMRGATDVPLETMRVCQQALRGAVIVTRNALRTAHSDVATGIELLVAASRGSALSIEANLDAITDAAYVSRTRTERDVLAADVTADASEARRILGYLP